VFSKVIVLQTYIRTYMYTQTDRDDQNYCHSRIADGNKHKSRQVVTSRNAVPLT